MIRHVNEVHTRLASGQLAVHLLVVEHSEGDGHGDRVGHEFSDQIQDAVNVAIDQGRRDLEAGKKGERIELYRRYTIPHVHTAACKHPTTGALICGQTADTYLEMLSQDELSALEYLRRDGIRLNTSKDCVLQFIDGKLTVTPAE